MFGLSRRASRWGSALIASVVTAAVVGVTLTAANDAEDPARTATLATAGVEEKLVRMVGVFRQPPASADAAAAAEIADALKRSGDATPGENPALVRRVDLSSGSVHLWPKTGGICASWGNCVPTEFIEERGVALSTEFRQRKDGSYSYVRVAGIARDGIDTVIFRLQGGRDVTATIRDNVFWVEFGSDVPESARWMHPNGTRQEQAGLLP
jgi:hypothetical protein